MSYRVLKRGTILIPSGPYNDPERKHLFIVCTDLCDEGRHLLVPVASWINDLCDPTCRLNAGDHGFISRPSYILYRKALIEDATTLEKGVLTKRLIPHDVMNAQVFLRVSNGICRSPQTPRRIKKYRGCPETPA